MPKKRKSDPPAVGVKEACAAAGKLKAAHTAKLRGEVVDSSEAAVLLGKRRAALKTQKEWREMSGRGGKACWSRMSPRERSLEMRRRAHVRRKNRRARLRAKLGKED